MTLEELLEKLDGLIESLGGQLSAALMYGHSGRLEDVFIDFNGEGIHEIIEALRHARAIVVAELGE